MKMKVSYDKQGMTMGLHTLKVEVNGHTFRKNVLKSTGRIFKNVKYMEVSDTFFEGSTEVNAKYSKRDQGFYFKLPSGKRVYACSEGLWRVGLPMSKLGKLYIKVR